MQLLSDPQVWLSFLILTMLEIVLGIDNIVFLSLLVERLPSAQRRGARLLGLVFAMLTRIALLFSITWLAGLRTPLAGVAGYALTGRALILAAGGCLLIVKSVQEFRQMRRPAAAQRPAGWFDRYWPIILQIGLIDLLFSLDTVFTAVGLANRIEVMVAAIVASVVIMMAVSGAVAAFIGRYPSIKVLALAFMVLVGLELVAQAADVEIPRGYLYFAMAFAGVVEWLNLALRNRARS